MTAEEKQTFIPEAETSEKDLEGRAFLENRIKTLVEEIHRIEADSKRIIKEKTEDTIKSLEV